MIARTILHRAVRVLVSAALALATVGLASPARAASPALVDIQAGDGFSCALLAGGTVRCWGTNDLGQLGIGTTVMSTIPQPVPDITTATVLSAGSSNGCVVLADGGVRCWGANAVGQVGDGTQTHRSAPVAVSGVSTAIGVAVGSGFACALLADHTVRCWGANQVGQLGDGTTTNSPIPVPVAGVADAERIVAGPAHACVLRATGVATCWGYNQHGQVRYDTLTEHEPPTDVTGVSDIHQLSLSSDTTCALVGDGDVTCWGGSPSDVVPPAPVAGIPADVADLEAIGRGMGCGALVDGTVACWGMAFDGGFANDLPAYRVGGVTGATTIDVGGRHACVIGPAMDACWGANDFGALGDRGTVSRGTPRPISWEPDPTPPTVTEPHIAITGVGRNGSNAVWAYLTWGSGDGASGTGVQGYEIGSSRDGGTTWSAMQPTTDRYAAPSLVATGSVRLRVRARDGAGNVSDWTAGPDLQPRIVQDGSSSIVYRGTWTRRASSSYLGGAVRMTTQAGAKATFTFTGRAVAYVTRMSETRGKVRIEIDGVSQGTSDLSYPAYGPVPVVAWERSWSTAGTHTVTIVALGTSGRPRVDLDAFVVIR